MSHDLEQARVLNSALALMDVAPSLLEGRQKAEVPSDLAFHLNLGPVQWDNPERSVIAVYPAHLILHASEGEPSDVKAQFGEIQVHIRASYRCDELTPEQFGAVPHFLGLTGWMHVWPYIRHEVHHLTIKLSLPPLVLPVVHVGFTRDVPVEHQQHWGR